MNSTSKNKWMAIGIVVLLLANITTLTVIWYMRAGQPLPFGPPPPQNQTFDFVVKELSLSTEQQAQYAALRTEHQQQTNKIRLQIKQEKDSLFSLIQQPAVADTAIQALIEFTALKQGELDMATFTHFRKLRAICTPAQQIKFDSIIVQVSRMIGPAGGGGRPGGPPPPHKPGEERGAGGPPPPPGKNN